MSSMRLEATMFLIINDVSEGFYVENLTLSHESKGLAEVGRLTVCTLRVFQHTYNEAELAEQTVFSTTISCDV